MIDDPALPIASRLLDTSHAAAMLAPGIAAGGGRLSKLTPTQVSYRPGHRIAVRYRAVVDWARQRRVETGVLVADVRRLPRGAAVLADESGQRVAAWIYPHDPLLPGLPSATAPKTVRALLTELGAEEGTVAITPRVYRPTSRAVLSVASTRRLYLKVVRPSAAEALYRRHSELAAALPVPLAYGVAQAQGIVALEARPGATLGAALAAGRAVPPPGALLSLLDRLAVASIDGAAPAPVSEATALHAATIAAIAPEEAARAKAVADSIGDAGWSPDRAVHGDFYESQLLVADGRVTALLDIDQVRAGDGLDDIATLLAHLTVLAWRRPEAQRRIDAYAGAFRQAAARRGDAQVLSRRIAAALLGLALWPFRAQLSAWPAATTAVLDLAAAALADGDGEDLLIAASPGLHRAG